MTNKLFIAGISYSTTTAQLEEYFATVGTVQSVSIITDRDTGQSKGFGFVEMATPEEAKQAIAQLNNTNLGGRALTVKEALPKTDSGSSDRSHGKSSFRSYRN